MQRDFWPRINPTHPLASGLVFAGLGGGASTTKYVDSSPRGNHGVLTNMDPATDWVWSSELGRQVLSFESASGQYVEVSPLTFVYPFTLAVWLQLLSGTQNNNVAISVGSSDASNVRHNIRVSFSGTINCGRCDTTSVSTNAGTGLSAGYHHVVMCVNAKNSADLYLDGTYVTTDVADSGGAGGWNRLFVGANADSTIDGYMNAKVSDPCAYSRALSAAEISALADPSNVMLSGLILPPRRRLWGVGGGAVPATKFWMWARQHRAQVIGGGVS